MVTTGPIDGPGGVENVAFNIMEQLEKSSIKTFAVHAYENYKNPITSAIRFRSIIKSIEKTHPDIVHTHDTSGYWISKSDMKYIHTSHGTWKHCFEYTTKSLETRIVQKLASSMEKNVVNNAKINVAISNFVKRYVSEEYDIRKKMHIIHNGVDTRKFKPRKTKKNKEGFTALWVGTNPALKGLDIALAAVKIAGMKLLVVGVDGNDTRGVKYLGRIEPIKMHTIFNMADILLFPSRFESYPIVPLEAMASGMPLVVSKSSHVETMKNGREGYIVKSEDPDKYASALAKAISNKEKMSKAGRKTAKKYDWSRQVKKYIRVYEKM